MVAALLRRPTAKPGLSTAGDDPQKDPFSNVAGPKKRQSRQSAAEVEELDDIQGIEPKVQIISVSFEQILSHN